MTSIRKIRLMAKRRLVHPQLYYEVKAAVADATLRLLRGEITRQEAVAMLERVVAKDVARKLANALLPKMLPLMKSMDWSHGGIVT